jgi:hypothetical protein
LISYAVLGGIAAYVQIPVTKPEIVVGLFITVFGW